MRSSMYDDFSTGTSFTVCIFFHYCFFTEVTERCKRLYAARNTSGSGDTPLHKVCRTGRYVSCLSAPLV